MSPQDLPSTSLSDRHFRSNFSYHNPQARGTRNEEATGNGSYSNRTPVRQSLYDWATAASERSTWSNQPGATLPPGPDPELPEQNNADESTLATIAHRRLLERESRRQLEPRDEPSGRIRVPAPRHRSPSEEEREEQIARLSAHGRSPSVTAALSRLIERQRIERRERRWEREHAVESGNGRSDDSSLRAARARALRELRSRERFAQYLDSRRRMRPPTMPKTANIIRYLSHLRDCGDYVEAHTLAAAMNLSTLFSPSSTTIPSDLTMSIDVLPTPQYSSFLAPGTRFDGLQRTPQEPPVVFLNRDRDYLRRMVANRNLNFSSANLPGSLTALMDAERLVQDMLEENPQANEAETSDTLLAGDLSQPNNTRLQSDGRRNAPTQLPDSWPVRATIHTLSLDTMTLTGTMCASHIPDKLSPTSPEHHPEGSSMESYFEGEIIDFNNFTLETGNERFKSGGVEIDARHWRGVGPFRDIGQTVRRQKLLARGATPNINGHNATSAQFKTTTIGSGDVFTYEEEEEMEGEIDEAVARCLGSTEWLAETMLRWVLMRWKGGLLTPIPPTLPHPLIHPLLRTLLREPPPRHVGLRPLRQRAHRPLRLVRHHRNLHRRTARRLRTYHIRLLLHRARPVLGRHTRLVLRSG